MSVAARAFAFFALTRPRLLPSALADVVAGTALAGGLAQCVTEDLVRGLAFSLLVYAGGMAANDVADAREDIRLSRPRPIALGEVSRVHASVFAALLLVGAVTVAPTVLGILPYTLLALVLLYDFVAKKTVWLGAPTLGVCRSMNLLSGAWIAQSGAKASSMADGASLLPILPGFVWIVIAGYGVYTAIAVVHGTLEDEATPRVDASSRLLFAAASIPFLLALLLRAPHWAALAAVPTLVLCVRAESTGPAWAGRRTGILLRGLSRFGFALACGMTAWLEAAILSIPAWVLPQVFKPKRWS